ncbi:hypothetical protein IWW55_005895, partial [Coemansia sp. RSA 2706]
MGNPALRLPAVAAAAAAAAAKRTGAHASQRTAVQASRTIARTRMPSAGVSSPARAHWACVPSLPSHG